jgi:hypothetical protein
LPDRRKRAGQRFSDCDFVKAHGLMRSLIDAGLVRPADDGCYSLTDIPESHLRAIRYQRDLASKTFEPV